MEMESIPQGKMSALFDLGVLYETGGDFDNFSAAANYYTHAAERGMSPTIIIQKEKRVETNKHTNKQKIQ